MTSTFSPRDKQRIERVVAALEAKRTRSALTELRSMFEHSSGKPPAILAACALLLNSDTATSPDILGAVRDAHAEWYSYGDAERALFSMCVHTSETRSQVAVSDVNDVTVMLRANPPQVSAALNALRWLDAVTLGERRELFITCATLLKNPSATHPAIVEAVNTAHEVWPQLDQPERSLLMSCVYASKERATAARERATARQQENEAESGDIHRCGNCEGNLAATPELPYCSTACQHEAESAKPPALVKPAHVPAEQRAQASIVVGEIETEYDEHYREIERYMPSVRAVRKDGKVVDAYELERNRHRDQDDSRDENTDLTGRRVTDDDYDKFALLTVAPSELCTACNLVRSVTEQLAPGNDRRCEMCRERNLTPLYAPAVYMREPIAA